MTNKHALNHETLRPPVASGCFWLLLILDESWCVMLTSSRERDEKKTKHGQWWWGIRRRCRRRMWRRNQEKKVKELKNGDCNLKKKRKNDHIKWFKNEWWKTPEKTETQSDGNLILFTAGQIRGLQQQDRYSSSTHNKGDRENERVSVWLRNCEAGEIKTS